MFMDPHPCQQHASLHHAVWQTQQEATRPKTRFKPTLPKKSGVDGGANQVPTYLGQLLHLYSPWWSSLAIITSNHCISVVCPVIKHPGQPYKVLSPHTAVAKTIVTRGKAIREKPSEYYLKAPQRVPHSTTYLKEQTAFRFQQFKLQDYVFVIVIIHFIF